MARARLAAVSLCCRVRSGVARCPRLTYRMVARFPNENGITPAVMIGRSHIDRVPLVLPNMLRR
jgi:hypothetical protein